MSAVYLVAGLAPHEREEAEEALDRLRRGDPVRSAHRRYFTLNGLELLAQEMGVDISVALDQGDTLRQRHQQLWDMLTSEETVDCDMERGGGGGGEPLAMVDDMSMDVDDEYEDEHGRLRPSARRFGIVHQTPDPQLVRLIEQFRQRHAPKPE